MLNLIQHCFCLTNTGCAGDSEDDRDKKGSGSESGGDGIGLLSIILFYFEMDIIVRVIIEVVVFDFAACLCPSSGENTDKFEWPGCMQGSGTEDHPRSISYWRYVRHSSSFYSSVLEDINCLIEPSCGDINTRFY